MKFEALGPLRVLLGDADVTPPGPIQRRVLAMLLLRANRAIPVGTLTDEIWPGDAPRRAQAKLQLAVHRLRGRLDTPERLPLEAAGYRLQVRDEEYDGATFDRLAAHLLVEQDPSRVVATAAEALALWRGPALADIPELGDDPEVRRWDERRRWVLETWAEAQLVLGNVAAVIDELERAHLHEPLHEPFAALLMRALRTGGRNAEALAVHERTRRALRDELGLDPGPALRAEQQQALDPTDAAGTAGTLVPAELPPPTALTGGERATARIGSPSTTRLCTVTGMAGVGKTAVAVAWAHQHREAYPDGQIFLDLRGYSDDVPVEPAAALARCLRSLGVRRSELPHDTAQRTALLRSMVASRAVLLLLDNALSTEQVRPLLVGGDSSTVLVTSRDALPGLTARDDAVTVEVEPLPAPAAQALLESLIGARAAAEPKAVARLARLCGELPLALRVAAQQVAVRPEVTIDELTGELIEDRDRLDLLDAEDGPLTDVRAVLSWSYRSLPPETAHTFRMLAQLPGADADALAISTLCDLPIRVTRRHLAALVRAHLLSRTSEGRYTQHDLLCAYARECSGTMDDAVALSEARGRLLHYYGRSAVAAGRAVFPNGQYLRAVRIDSEGAAASFNDVGEARAWLQREWPNALAAIEQAGDEHTDAVLAVQYAWGIHLYDSGLHEDAVRVHRLAQDLALRTGAVEAEFSASMGLGMNLASLGDFDGAEEAFRRGVHVARRTGRADRVVSAQSNLNMLQLTRGKLREAEAGLSAALAAARESGTSYQVAIGLQCVALCRLGAGDGAGAEALLLEELALCDAEDLRLQRPDALRRLADAAFLQGDLDRSESLARDAEEHAEEVRSPYLAAGAMAARGRAAIRLGRDSEGFAALREAMTIARRSGAVELVMDVLGKHAQACADRSNAVALHREAIDYAHSHGLAGDEANLRASLGRVLAERGAEDAAVETARAAELYTDLDDPRADALEVLLRTWSFTDAVGRRP